MSHRRNGKVHSTRRRSDAVNEEPVPFHTNGESRGDTLRFIDLFCGIGGFRFAFESAGAQCVFSCDWDKHSQRTYEANFGETPEGDINSPGIEEKIGEFDILCAGFPCQPFSIAGVSKKNSLGRKHGFQCEKQGNLFFRIADILKKRRPAAFVLENVKNLKSHDKGRTWQTIESVLQDPEDVNGYNLKYHIFPATIDAKYVVPQHRERIFIVGFRDLRDFEFPKFPSEGPRLGSILESVVPDKYTLSDHLWNYLQKYAQKHQAAGNGFGFGLFNGKDVARTLSARYYKDGSEILISQGPRKNPRRLTPQECARLMGYEKKFIGKDFVFPLKISDTQAYKQFGNSVVVPVVKKIAEAVVARLRQGTNHRPNFALTAEERTNGVAGDRIPVPVTYPKPRKHRD